MRKLRFMMMHHPKRIKGLMVHMWKDLVQVYISISPTKKKKDKKKKVYISSDIEQLVRV